MALAALCLDQMRDEMRDLSLFFVFIWVLLFLFALLLFVFFSFIRGSRVPLMLISI